MIKTCQICLKKVKDAAPNTKYCRVCAYERTLFKTKVWRQNRPRLCRDCRKPREYGHHFCQDCGAERKRIRIERANFKNKYADVIQDEKYVYISDSKIKKELRQLERSKESKTG